MRDDRAWVLFDKVLKDNLRLLEQGKEPTDVYMDWIVGLETYEGSHVREEMVYNHTRHHMYNQGIDMRGVSRSLLVGTIRRHLLTLERYGYIDVITKIHERKTHEQERKRLSEDVRYRELRLNTLRSISTRLSRWWKAWHEAGYPNPPVSESIRAYIAWVEKMTPIIAPPIEWDEELRQYTYGYVDEHLTPIIPEMGDEVYEIMASHMTTIRTMK